MMTILKNSEGFTLIEALIATLILSVGLLALGGMQMSSVKGNTTANKLTIASTSANSGYELLLNMSYFDPAMDPGTHTQAELPGLVLPEEIESLTWDVTLWTVTDGLDNDGDGEFEEADERQIKSIDLNINYTNRAVKTMTINFLKSEML
jgi:type II secretory pathway pseudopilin PulG